MPRRTTRVGIAARGTVDQVRALIGAPRNRLFAMDEIGTKLAVRNDASSSLAYRKVGSFPDNGRCMRAGATRCHVSQ